MKNIDVNSNLINQLADYEDKNNLQGYTVHILSVTSNFPAQKWMKTMKMLEAKMKRSVNTEMSHISAEV
jgi:hypothetical protein